MPACTPPRSVLLTPRQATVNPRLCQTPKHAQVSLAQSLVGSLLLSLGCWCTKGFVCASHPSPSEGGQNENHSHRKLTKLITWTRALSTSVKLGAMLCRATYTGRPMLESSDRMWSTGEGDGKPLQPFCLENLMNWMKRQKDMTLKDGLPRFVGAQYATGDQWRNSPRRNEEMESKQKQRPAVDASAGETKVRRCKEQYCLGTWNVRSRNQDKTGSSQTGYGKGEHRQFRNQ